MRWRILALLFLARVGLGFQFQTLASVGDDLVVAFGLTHAEVGTLIGLFMASGLFLAFPAGLATRIASDRALAAFGLAALAAGGMISGLAPDPWTIGVGRLVAGVGFLVSTLYFTKMIADWFAGREITTAMSILVMSWPFGIAIGQIGHAWFAANADWRAPFIAASIYCVVAAFAILALYRPATVQHSPLPLGSKATSQFGLSSQEWALVVAAGIAWGVFNAGYVGYLTYGPKSLEGHGATPLEAAGIISIASWLMILSGAACGQLVDRMGRRNQVLTICMAGAVASLLLLQVDGAGLLASVLFGLIGMAPAGVIMALAGEAVPPERRAFGMGAFFTIYYAIMTAGPPIVGWLYDSWGTTMPLLFAALLFLAVLPAVLAFDIAQAGGTRKAVPS
jgi:MFS family permease